MYLFVTKMVLFKLGKIENQPIPFWLQKGTKKCENLWNLFFRKLWPLSFQKTSQPCLDHVWNGFYALVKFGRNHPKVPFWPFFIKTDGATWDHKFWSKHRKNILRPDFESLRAILSISNFIFIYSCLFVTRTVFQAYIGKTEYWTQ